MSSGTSRGRSFRNDGELSRQIPYSTTPHNNNNGTKLRGKKLKQFSTRSRSKSNANFKGLTALQRTASHDDSVYRSEGTSSVNNGSVKRARSYESLNRRKAISMLGMTALALSKFNPNTVGNSSAGGGNSHLSRSIQRNEGKSVLELHESEEMYEEDSTTDEEVDYLSDGQGFAEDSKDYREESKEYVDALDTNGMEKKEKDEEKVDIKRTGSGGSLVDPRQEGSNALNKVQLSYKPPSSLRNKVEDRIGSNAVEEDTDRIEQHEDDIINSKCTVVETAHSLERQGPVSDKNSEDLDQKMSEQDKRDNGLIDPVDEHYVQDMILSQSTGVVRHFNQTLSRQNSLVSHSGLIENGYDQPNFAASNRFNYINSDLASSLKSTEIKNEDKPTKDFSTSISSLTSHLHARPTASRSSTRANTLLSNRVPQSKMLRNQPSSLLDNNCQQRGIPTGVLNNFSQFLQSGDQGTESRTQQKLWLQRESSLLSLPSQTASSNSILMATNIEVRREFERISNEYMNVRRFGNPLNDSITRVMQKNKIDMKKLNKSSLPVDDSTGSSFFGTYQRNVKSFGELHPEIANRDLEIQQMLSTIWSENVAEFNKDNNPLSKQWHSLQQNLKSSRTRNPSTAASSQRLVNSLQPMTKAVNRRMENAMSQQRL
ncbi:HER048Wp [Eremothecium sinecaudum]|uniref:HER048Wp n=1 Tax=Eremothecium sinecaudum TaxID=45286 RepID=A0A0X8HTS8_9SACH|nr:HER048Wp [Eremothecium sinecaudum]AMD21327.1 HER048Wp [Eremothecium sinecaudum]